MMSHPVIAMTTFITRQAEAWNMRLVLEFPRAGSSGRRRVWPVLPGERVFHLDRAHIQTLMY